MRTTTKYTIRRCRQTESHWRRHWPINDDERVLCCMDSMWVVSGSRNRQHDVCCVVRLRAYVSVNGRSHCRAFSAPFQAHKSRLWTNNEHIVKSQRIVCGNRMQVFHVHVHWMWCTYKWLACSREIRSSCRRRLLAICRSPIFTGAVGAVWSTSGDAWRMTTITTYTQTKMIIEYLLTIFGGYSSCRPSLSFIFHPM